MFYYSYFPWFKSVNPNRKIIFILLIIIFYLVIFQPFAARFFTIDDMYISLRYAKNWASGLGLVWNSGEAPVEGYSNFSFVILSALAIKFGVNPVVLLKTIGWFSLLIVSISLYYLSRLWFKPELALIPIISLMYYKGEILWAVSGLETTFYQSLIILALFYLLRGNGYNLYPLSRGMQKNTYLILSALIMVLASLTRPEAPFLMLIFLIITWFDISTYHSNYYLKSPYVVALVFCFFYIPYFIWRYNYYGYLFPNPIYCKGFSDSFLLLDKYYLILAWVFLLLSILGVSLTRDKRIYYLILPSLLYLILLMYADPIVAFFNRLYLPAFSLLLVSSLIGLSIVVNSMFLKFEDNQRYLITGSVFLMLTGLFIPGLSLQAYQYFAVNSIRGEKLRNDVVNWLTNKVPNNSKVVLADSGKIPYLSSLNFIDSYCLNNKLMTQYPSSDTNIYIKFCHDIFKIKPTAIILTSLREQGNVSYTPVDECLRFSLNENLYKLSAYFQSGDQQSSYRYEIYTVLN